MSARFLAITAVVASVIIGAGCQEGDKALFESAELQWHINNYEKAAGKLERLVEEYPDSKYFSRALFKLGEIYYYNLEDHKVALDYFIQSTVREPDETKKLEAHEHIAAIYDQSLGEHDLAILQYQKILNEHTHLINADEYRMRIGSVYYRKGDYEQAVTEYQILLEEFPKSELALDAQYQIASCKFIQGKLNEAMEIYNKMLKDSPGNKYEYDILLGIAACYDEMDQLKEAKKIYTKMKKTYPNKELVTRKLDSIKRRLKLRKRK